MANPRGHILLAYFCLMLLTAAALTFHYDFSNPGDLNSPDLLRINDSSLSGDRIDLTLVANWSGGRLAYGHPVRLWDSSTGKVANFKTSFSFAIGGIYNNSRGDGLAFFIGTFPPRLPPDSLAWFLGLTSDPNNMRSPPIVAVEFDTVRNPGIDPENGIDHVGIDINSVRSTSYTGLPTMGLYGTMRANIVYDAGSTIMSVTLRLADQSTYNIYAPVDFREAGVPENAAVGFSAATGDWYTSHQILSWSFDSTDITDASNNSRTRPWVIPTLIAACAVLVAVLLAALLFMIIRKWFRRSAMRIPLPVAREFSYLELRSATQNFDEARMLGAGSFGQVYSGDLPDLQVAVKRLTGELEQTWRDYVTEIMTMGQLSHRNLVKLVGWNHGGRNGHRRLLVYELMENRSVDKHLYELEGRPLLPWPKRYKIVLGVSRAIEYLHTGCNGLVILHRDIKPSNVMLDDTFEAKLGDFGLVRRLRPGQGSLGTAMFGSRDYMDPSCVATNTVSTESDMYSFGVMLLEMATGRRPSLLQGRGGCSNVLVDAVRQYNDDDNVLKMADERLCDVFDKSQMERVLVVGLLCTQQNRQDRLEIRVAVNLLSDLSNPVPQLGPSPGSTDHGLPEDEVHSGGAEHMEDEIRVHT